MNDLHFKLVQEENNNLMAFFQHTCAGKVLLHFSVGPSTKDVSSNCTDGYPRWNQDKKGPNRCFSWTFFSVFFFFCPYLEGPCPRQDSMAVIWGPMGQGACKSPYLQGSTKLKGLKPLKLYFSVKELHHLFFFLPKWCQLVQGHIFSQANTKLNVHRYFSVKHMFPLFIVP